MATPGKHHQNVSPKSKPANKAKVKKTTDDHIVTAKSGRGQGKGRKHRRGHRMRRLRKLWPAAAITVLVPLLMGMPITVTYDHGKITFTTVPPAQSAPEGTPAVESTPPGGDLPPMPCFDAQSATAE